jgi:molybdate transport system regulatory protein
MPERRLGVSLSGPLPSDPMPSATSPTLGRNLTGRIKGWLTFNGEFLLGPRYVQLLEGIERTGTIREGCQATRMSYRTCLARIRRMEAALGAQLVATQRGGSSRGSATLTPLARRLIRIYREWRDAVELASQTAFAGVMENGRSRRRTGPARPARTRRR